MLVCFCIRGSTGILSFRKYDKKLLLLAILRNTHTHTQTEKFRLQRKIKLLENARLVNFCVLHYAPKIEHEQNREDYSEAMSEMH